MDIMDRAFMGPFFLDLGGTDFLRTSLLWTFFFLSTSENPTLESHAATSGISAVAKQHSSTLARYPFHRDEGYIWRLSLICSSFSFFYLRFSPSDEESNLNLIDITYVNETSSSILGQEENFSFDNCNYPLQYYLSCVHMTYSLLCSPDFPNFARLESDVPA